MRFNCKLVSANKSKLNKPIAAKNLQLDIPSNLESLAEKIGPETVVNFALAHAAVIAQNARVRPEMESMYLAGTLSEDMSEAEVTDIVQRHVDALDIASIGSWGSARIKTVDIKAEIKRHLRIIASNNGEGSNAERSIEWLVDAGFDRDMCLMASQNLL